MATTEAVLDFERYLDLPDKEGYKCELDEGVVIEMPPPSFSHGTIQAKLAHLLLQHIERTGAEYYVSQAAGFRLAVRTVRAPDICLVRRGSYAGMKAVRGVLEGAPDLAVEVVSKTDRATDIDRKVQQYLGAGTTVVWVIYPDTCHVIVYRRSGETKMVAAAQMLDEKELLPGFQVPVEQIFSV